MRTAQSALPLEEARPVRAGAVLSVLSVAAFLASRASGS
jgi:hypothetical protein